MGFLRTESHNRQPTVRSRCQEHRLMNCCHHRHNCCRRMNLHNCCHHYHHCYHCRNRCCHRSHLHNCCYQMSCYHDLQMSHCHHKKIHYQKNYYRKIHRYRLPQYSTQLLPFRLLPLLFFARFSCCLSGCPLLLLCVLPLRSAPVLLSAARSGALYCAACCSATAI